jgi:hypothetical protein
MRVISSRVFSVLTLGGGFVAHKITVKVHFPKGKLP